MKGEKWPHEQGGNVGTVDITYVEHLGNLGFVLFGIWYNINHPSVPSNSNGISRIQKPPRILAESTILGNWISSSSGKVDGN